MRYYVGLDVSLKSTHICVLDGDRQRGLAPAFRIRRLRCSPGILHGGASRLCLFWKLETGSLTPWLLSTVSAILVFPCMVCMDARRASDVLKARAEKTDKADARALAEMLASGWYLAVHVKSLESHQLKALLGARRSAGSGQAQALQPGSVACCGPSGSRYLSGSEPSLSMRLCE